MKILDVHDHDFQFMHQRLRNVKDYIRDYIHNAEHIQGLSKQLIKAVRESIELRSNTVDQFWDSKKDEVVAKIRLQKAVSKMDKEDKERIQEQKEKMQEEYGI